MESNPNPRSATLPACPSCDCSDPTCASEISAECDCSCHAPRVLRHSRNGDVALGGVVIGRVERGEDHGVAAFDLAGCRVAEHADSRDTAAFLLATRTGALKAGETFSHAGRRGGPYVVAPSGRPAGRGPSVPEDWTLDDAGIAHPPSRTLPERAFVERALSIMSDDPADGSEPELERLRRLPDAAPLGDDPLATDAAACLELVRRELADRTSQLNETCEQRDRLYAENERLRAELERAYLGDFPPPVPTEGA